MEDKDNIIPFPISHYSSFTQMKLDKNKVIEILSKEDDNIEITSQIMYVAAKDFKGNNIREDGKEEYEITLRFSIFK